MTSRKSLQKTRTTSVKATRWFTNKIVNFFLPFKNIINNLHWFLIAASSNTEPIKSQINTCQNLILSVEAVNHIPKSEQSVSICRLQAIDRKQLHQSSFLKKLNTIWLKAKLPSKQEPSLAKVKSESSPVKANPELCKTQASFKSKGFEEESKASFQKPSPNLKKYELSDDRGSREEFSNASDNDPISSSMFIQHDVFNPAEEPKKAPTSKMALKMKSMQDMLNQKLKKVKNNINWDIEED